MHEIKTQEMRFVDALGRERIFHGLNLKVGMRADDPEYGDLKLMDESFFQRSAAMGFNVLRLGIGWEYFEPEKGQLNEGLLQRIDEVFAMAAQYNMYIFLDMHQDLYSSFGVGNGHGMPLWATLDDGHKRRKNARLAWAEGYWFSRAVHSAFDHFWNNTPVLGKGLQDHFAEHWQMLARRYADSPAFMGFDLLNEPFPGKDGGKAFRKLITKLIRVVLVSPSVHRIQFLKTVLNKKTRDHALDVLTPEVLYKVTQGGAADRLHQKFYKEKYGPFIAKMASAIREVTPKGIIFVEHSYFSNIAVPFSVDLPKEEAICYSPHGYDFTVDTPAYNSANDARVQAIFDENRKAQLEMNVPVLVGEWGAGYMGEGCYAHIGFLCELFETYNWSYAYFTYTKDLYDSTLMPFLVRPYPVAVNGTIRRFGYNKESRTFTLVLHQDAGVDPAQATEIFLPRAAELVQAEGFSWQEEAIVNSGAKRLLLTGSKPGESVVTVRLIEEK